MSKYTRFTTTRRVPRTLQLGRIRVSFLTNEYTTDRKEEIEALQRLAEEPRSGIIAHEEKVDYLTPREATRQRIQHASSGMQASARSAVQHVKHVKHHNSSVPLMQRVAQAATPQAEVPKSQATAAKVTAAEAAEVLKTVTPPLGNPLAPKAETK